MRPAAGGLSRVTRWAVLSRLCTVAACAITAAVVPDYDSSSRLQRLPAGDSVWAVTSRLLLPLGSNWDGAYFTALASGHAGYEFEQFHAFFPGFPLLINTLTSGLAALFGIDFPAHLAAIALSNAAFVLAARELFLLTAAVFSDPFLESQESQKGRRRTEEEEFRCSFAERTALLFVLTPAGVFHSAGYTESLFALLSFAGLRRMVQLQVFPATILFALAGGVRSNALLFGGYVFAQFFWWTGVVVPRKASEGAGAAAAAAAAARHAEGASTGAETVSDSSPSSSEGSRIVAVPLPPKAVGYLRYMVVALSCSAVIALPFVGFQWYAYSRFCMTPQGAASFPEDAVGATARDNYTFRPWCNRSSFMAGGALPVPNLYGFVQDQYWDQGFLRYWKLKQLPNFALGAPMVVLSALGITQALAGYLKNFPRIAGVVEIRDEGAGGQSATPPQRRLAVHFRGTMLPSVSSFRAFPVVVYWAAMLVLCVTSTHIQTITRFFSSIPAVFWFAAEFSARSRVHAALLLVYFVGFNVLGVVLFPAFLPWT